MSSHTDARGDAETISSIAQRSDSTETAACGAAPAPVSVVVPCFRCADTIAAAVASVAAQTLPPSEVLLVDDGSGDHTLERLKQVAQCYPDGWVKVFALPRNSGPSAARNRGWAAATQPWIAFLDADDTWHPNKVKMQMDVLRDDPSAALISHRMNVQSRSEPAPALRYPVKARVLRWSLVPARNSLPTASIMLRRNLPFRFDEQRRRAEDFFLWAQIMLSGYRCVCIDQVLASWHKEPFGVGGLSGDMPAMYAAAVDVRRALHAQGLLSKWQMSVAHAVGLARYIRRLVLTFARRRAAAWRTRSSG